MVHHCIVTTLQQCSSTGEHKQRLYMHKSARNIKHKQTSRTMVHLKTNPLNSTHMYKHRALVHYCIGTSLHWYTTTSVHQYWRTTALVHYCTGTLLHWYTTAALVHYCIGTSLHWYTTICIGASLHWCITALVHHDCIGTSLHWCTRVLQWSVPPVCSGTSVPMY